MTSNTRNKNRRIVRVLKGALRLLEKGWIQGCSAETAGREMCNVNSPSARYFCVSGAVQRAVFDAGVSTTTEVNAFSALSDRTRNGDPVAFNDASWRKRYQVINLVKRTIKGLTSTAKKGKKR